MIRPLLASSLAAVFACSSFASELIADIEYGVADGESLRLDISIPDGEGPFPVAFLIHGGGWGSGDKSGAEKPNSGADITPWFQPLTDAGFVWVSINYRLSPQHRWPAAKEDTLAALTWVNQRIGDYQGDPNRIAVFGHSTGGHLAMITAFADEAIRPEAVVGCAAVTDSEQELPHRGGVSTSLQNLFDQPFELTAESLNIIRRTAPINLLQLGMPPVLLVHGDADKTVPFVQSIELQRRTQVLGTPCDLLTLPNAQHRLTEWEKHDPDWMLKTIHWLQATLNHAPTPDSTYWQKSQNKLHLVPDPNLLPTPSGEVRDLFTRQGCNFSLSWKNRQLEQLEIVATQNGSVTLSYGDAQDVTLSGDVGTRWILDRKLKILQQDKAFHAYVAADGSGQYMTIEKAIVSGPANLAEGDQWIIQIAPGTYQDQLYIQRERSYLTLRGYDAASTILTNNLHANTIGPDGKPLGTFRTASTTIDADVFTAEKLTFENAAGPVGQALAIRLDGDRSVFRNCRFLGWQDTILANKGRHYFENCYIAGHVDFIFGGATCYFERCHIHCLKNGYITAASTPAETAFGYVFNHCRITGADPDTRTYLGRPWRDFAAVAFYATSMDETVRPEGWHNWGKPERETSSRYSESASFGPGANNESRVPWAQTPGPTLTVPPTPQEVLGQSDGWNPQLQ